MKSLAYFLRVRPSWKAAPTRWPRQRDMIRIRISKADFEAGFKFRHLGEVLYAKVKSEFEAVVDKCQVKIVVATAPDAFPTRCPSPL